MSVSSSLQTTDESNWSCGTTSGLGEDSQVSDGAVTCKYYK